MRENTALSEADRSMGSVSQGGLGLKVDSAQGPHVVYKFGGANEYGWNPKRAKWTAITGDGKPVSPSEVPFYRQPPGRLAKTPRNAQRKV